MWMLEPQLFNMPNIVQDFINTTTIYLFCVLDSADCCRAVIWFSIFLCSFFIMHKRFCISCMNFSLSIKFCFKAAMCWSISLVCSLAFFFSIHYQRNTCRINKQRIYVEGKEKDIRAIVLLCRCSLDELNGASITSLAYTSAEAWGTQPSGFLGCYLPGGPSNQSNLESKCDLAGKGDEKRKRHIFGVNVMYVYSYVRFFFFFSFLRRCHKM